MHIAAMSISAAAIALPMAPMPDFGVDATVWMDSARSTSREQPKRPSPSNRTNLFDLDFERAKVEVQALKALARDWDGRGGVAPSDSTISEAINFLSQMPSGFEAPSVEPSTDGEVNLVWRSAGFYVEVGFDGDGVGSYLAKNLTDGTRLFSEFRLKEFPTAILPYLRRAVSAALRV